MSKYSQTPGCYTLPLGSDMLWHLASHRIERQDNDCIIILPTDRAVHRLKRILYKLNPEISERTVIISYDKFVESKNTNTTTHNQILWSLIDDPKVLNEFFLSSTPRLEQKQQLCTALSSALSELFAHEIEISKIEPIAQNDTSTSQLLGVIKRFQGLMQQHLMTHPATALNEGIRRFHDQLSSTHETVYLVIDGPIPLSLQHFAAALIPHHFVWVYGNIPIAECNPHDPNYCYRSLFNLIVQTGHTIHPLPVYAHRRPLIDELQQPLFRAKNISGAFNDIHFIESKDPVTLAHQIVKIAKDAFSDTVRSVSIVTPSRDLANIIHLAANCSNILVDDSFGHTLNETLFGSLLLNLMHYFKDPRNYKLLLDILMHPLLHKYWAELPSKIDEYGRTKQVSFMSALRTYSPEDDTENELLLELIQLTQLTRYETFDKVVAFAHDCLNKWKIDPNVFPEYQEINLLAESAHQLEAFEYILSTTPFRTITPKEHHIKIMGPLEVRLTHPKFVIIADLNEGEWPISTPSNPWLHARLREQLGLPNAAQITGVSSKILMSLLGCQKVYLCRTTHQSNHPTTPSRWWERIKMISHLNKVTINSSSKNESDIRQPLTQLSSFKIPNELIPKRISISQFHLLLNDPSQFILNCVLKLEELPHWEAPADSRHKGIIVHDALENAIKQNLSIESTLKYAIDKLHKIELDAHERMFWTSQVTDYIHSFYKLHNETAPKHTWTEILGEWTVNTQYGSIVIVGKADRIDLRNDGTLHIIDYKTGTIPAKQSVYQGLTPQLPLLGIMALRGCFQNIPSTSPFILSYWGLKDSERINFLFDELSHLEEQFVTRIEQLLDTKTVYALA